MKKIYLKPSTEVIETVAEPLLGELSKAQGTAYYEKSEDEDVWNGEEKIEESEDAGDMW